MHHAYQGLHVPIRARDDNGVVLHALDICAP